MIRRFGMVLVFLAVIGSMVGMPQQRASAARPAAISAAAPGPMLIAEVNGPGRGRVWVGAVPAYSSSKPVLVFVHGLHGKAQNWWSATVYSGVNDMYDRAYASGYRTAFVSLDDEVDGPASTMWANGSTLNRQLDVILRHYGVSSVNIIAHSKGGVDTNSAVVHYGASSKVQNIVTLSSPHRGSQLADLAYSWWAGWLATLLGQKDDGTYTMQTGYMSYFRSVTDSSPAYGNVRFHTAGGTDWGPWFSAMWFGGSYLPGDNDGVVTVASSHHPRQTSRLFTSSSLNHDNIRKGSDVWWRIEPTVRGFFRSAQAQDSVAVEEIEKAAAPASTTSSLILRGGQMSARATTLSLPIEGGVNKVTFDLLSDQKNLTVTFVDPQGKRYAASAAAADAEAFKGASHYVVEVTAPASGQWTVDLSGPRNTAYMLIANLDSPLSVGLTRSQGVVAPNASLKLNVAGASKGAPVKALTVDGLLSGTAVGKEQLKDLKTQTKVSMAGADKAAATLSAPASAGLYQLGLTVTGIAADGTAFERSFATNFPVADAATSGDALGAGR